MSFNISKFASNIENRGLARTNLFVASITSPDSMNLPVEADLLFLCKSASIPGLSLDVATFSPQGWGRVDQMPTGISKDNLTLSFMVDSNFAVQQYFHRWMQSIVNYNELNGQNSADLSGNKLPYEFDYKNNFSGVIDVVVYSEHDNSEAAKTYTYQFNKAFPVSISALETSWENSAEIMVVTVSFAYSSVAVSGMEDTEVADRQISYGQPSSGFSSGEIGGALTGGTTNIASDFFQSTNLQSTIDSILSPINKIANAGNNFISSIKRIF